MTSHGCARDEVRMKSLYANLDTWRPYALSILRIVVALLLQHGLSKFFGFPAEGPPLSGLIILAAIIEAFGSLLLLVGVTQRVRYVR